MISLDLMKLSEVRIAGDRSNNHTKHFDNSTVVGTNSSRPAFFLTGSSKQNNFALNWLLCVRMVSSKKGQKIEEAAAASPLSSPFLE